MSSSITPLTSLTAKDVQFMQPHRSLKWCQRQLQQARQTAGAAVALVKHLADYWAVEADDIISQLRPRFGVN